MKKFKFLAALAAMVLLFSGCQRNTTLTRNDAQAIALENAGYTVQEVWDLEVEFERAWSGDYYEVSFDTAAKEYEYKIDAQSGTVLYRETDRNHR